MRARQAAHEHWVDLEGAVPCLRLGLGTKREPKLREGRKGHVEKLSTADQDSTPKLLWLTH